MKNKEIINHTDLVVGISVCDDNNNVGTVKECSDLHNVNVHYDNGGSGLYCIIESCHEYDPLYHYKHKKRNNKLTR